MKTKHNTVTEQEPRKTARRILVIGGDGFIGSHIVKSLRRERAEVVVGGRRSSGGSCDQKRAEVIVGGRRNNGGSCDGDRKSIDLGESYAALEWDQHLRDVDGVVNAVGILRQRAGESYERVHHLSVADLAAACARRSLPLVHVSILGVDSPVKSRFVSSKKAGEKAVEISGADYLIVRPSLVDGVKGFGAHWFHKVARWPVHPIPANAKGMLAPIDADDLGDAIAKLTLYGFSATSRTDRIIELGGDKVMAVQEYLRVLDPSPKDKRVIRIPSWLARAVSHVCDLIHLTPFSFGHYELLQHRNYSEHNRLKEVLGRAPTPIVSRETPCLKHRSTPK